MPRHPLLLLLLGTIGCATREEGEACLVLDTGETSCPAPEDVDLADLQSPSECDLEAVEMLSTETPEASSPFDVPDAVGCCYQVMLLDPDPKSECMVGRPLLAEGAPVLPTTEDLADPVAAARLHIAAMELASVAAFARFSWELLAHGAPAELLSQAARAQKDEVRHAVRWQRLAEKRLAAKRVGRPLVLGAMPLPALPAPRSLAEFAAETVREGCLGETLSALVMRAAAEAAGNMQLRRTLLAIAREEERHAALAWSTVAWARRVGGPEVRAAIAAAFRAPYAMGPMIAVDGFEREGLLGPTATARALGEGFRAVVAPAATALLAA